MKTCWAAICLSLVAVPDAFAERVALTELGASVWLPSGWQAQNLETTDSSRLYMIDDTTLDATNLRLRHSGVVLVQAKSGVYTSGIGSRPWIQSEGDAWSYVIQYSSLLGTLIVDDTTYWTGLWAREVYGLYRDDLEDSAKALMVRATAQGDLGWEAWIEADTADADTAMRTYVEILDSIRLDTGLTTLPISGIRTGRPSRSPGAILLASIGGSVRVASRTRPQMEVFDLRGREVPGNLSRGPDGFWYWTPSASTRSRLLLARAKADGASSATRLVLEP